MSARAILISPEAMLVRKDAFWPSVPESRIACPHSATVEKKGPGRRKRPISSRRTARSRKLMPAPPYHSGNGSPSQPKPAIFRQSSGEWPVSCVSISLTRDLGHSISRNSLPEDRSISCSFVRAKSMIRRGSLSSALSHWDRRCRKAQADAAAAGGFGRSLPDRGAAATWAVQGPAEQ